jgi:glycosyltransferase involved in cell wall biosynthesis
MRVLIISHFFYPEMMAIAKRMKELGEDLIAKGHEVTVLTGFPNYPDGVIQPQYRGKFFQIEHINGIKVIRAYVYASHNKIFGERLFNHTSFMISSVLEGLFPTGNPDVILAISPPLFTGVSASIFSKFKGIPFVFDVQDIYPDAAIALGMLSNQYIIHLAQWLEKGIYRNAERIAVISNGFKENLKQKGISLERIEVVPNWVDVNRFYPDIESKSIRQQWGLTDKFVVMFVGSLGIGQKPQIIIQSAKQLKTQKNIVFVFVGGGVEKQECLLLCEKYQLQNVLFIPPQPMESIPQYIGASDVCLVHLKDIPIFNITIPSKIYEYMAGGRPIIIAVKDEARKLVEDAQCGVYVEPENPDMLAEAILHLYRKEHLRTEYGGNGRLYAVRNYSRDIVTSKYTQILLQVAGRAKKMIMNEVT